MTRSAKHTTLVAKAKTGVAGMQRCCLAAVRQRPALGWQLHAGGHLHLLAACAPRSWRVTSSLRRPLASPSLLALFSLDQYVHLDPDSAFPLMCASQRPGGAGPARVHEACARRDGRADGRPMARLAACGRKQLFHRSRPDAWRGEH